MKETEEFVQHFQTLTLQQESDQKIYSSDLKNLCPIYLDREMSMLLVSTSLKKLANLEFITTLSLELMVTLNKGKLPGYYLVTMSSRPY